MENVSYLAVLYSDGQLPSPLLTTVDEIKWLADRKPIQGIEAHDWPTESQSKELRPMIGQQEANPRNWGPWLATTIGHWDKVARASGSSLFE